MGKPSQHQPSQSVVIGIYDAVIAAVMAIIIVIMSYNQHANAQLKLRVQMKMQSSTRSVLLLLLGGGRSPCHHVKNTLQISVSQSVCQSGKGWIQWALFAIHFYFSVSLTSSNVQSYCKESFITHLTHFLSHTHWYSLTNPSLKRYSLMSRLADNPLAGSRWNSSRTWRQGRLKTLDNCALENTGRVG